MSIWDSAVGSSASIQPATTSSEGLRASTSWVTVRPSAMPQSTILATRSYSRSAWQTFRSTYGFSRRQGAAPARRCAVQRLASHRLGHIWPGRQQVPGGNLAWRALRAGGSFGQLEPLARSRLSAGFSVDRQKWRRIRRMVSEPSLHGAEATAPAQNWFFGQRRQAQQPNSEAT